MKSSKFSIKLTISVIIPTYIRPKYLLQTIEEVINQGHPAVCEIIVVDQTPKDLIPNGFYEKLEELKKKISLIYLYKEIANLPAARNSALQIAKGEIILMLDDDVLLPANFIEEHYNNYNNDNNIIMVVGLPYERLNKYISQIDQINVNNFKEFTAPFFKENKKDRNWTGLMVGVNHSVLKAYALKLEGYDENFIGSGYFEDFDFLQRLRKSFANKKTAYNPEAFVVHLRAPSGGCRRQDVRNTWLFSVSTHIYMWRYKQWNLFWRTMRAGPLLKKNVFQFWKQPILWWGFVKSLILAYQKRGNNKSIFAKNKNS